MPIFTRTTLIPDATAAELFAWHTAPGALSRLLPPTAGVRIVRSAPLTEGSEVELSVPIAGPIRQRWLARHSAVTAPSGFVDEEVSGPFPAWRHEHRFADVPGGAQLTDVVTYTAPGGPLAGAVDALMVGGDLHRTFAWRHARTQRDLARHRAFASVPRATVGITGATGLVAGELIPFLTTAGHQVRPFTRRGGAAADPIAWDPTRGTIDDAALAACDTVVHLAGASVAKRWTPAYQDEIRTSRIAGTRLIAEAVARQAGRIKTLIIASGVNIYPSGEVELGEDAPTTGSGFLAQVVRDWEAAAAPAVAAGVRVVHLRIGMVLSPQGGGLAQLLTPAKFGLGGPVAGGRQYISWIDLDDLVGLIGQAILDPSLSGVVNAVAPQAVRQGDFAAILGRVLHRPALAPFPGFAVRLLFGQMGEELLLPSIRVVPSRALAAGFRFSSPDLESALRFQLARV